MEGFEGLGTFGAAAPDQVVAIGNSIFKSMYESIPSRVHLCVDSVFESIYALILFSSPSMC